MFTAFTTAATILPAESGSFISALPPPFAATLGAGQPIFISIKSGLKRKAALAASAIILGLLPKSCEPNGRSLSDAVSSAADFLSFSTTPRELVSSPTVNAAP